MANVSETPTYDAGIYQLEIIDQVLGGSLGVSNAQAKGLANRTAYLKAHVDAIEQNPFKFRTVIVLAADTTLTATHFGALIVVQGNAGPVTLTLPATTTTDTMKRLFIANKAAFDVVITPTGGNTIEGAGSLTLKAVGDYADLTEDHAHTNFVIASSKITTPTTSKVKVKAKPADYGTNSGTYVDLAGAVYNAPNDGITRHFMVMFKSDVSTGTSAGDGGLIRIVNGATYECLTEAYLDVVGTNVDLLFVPAVVIDYIDVLPNTTVKIQVQSVSGGNVNFKNNCFLMFEQ